MKKLHLKKSVIKNLGNDDAALAQGGFSTRFLSKLIRKHSKKVTKKASEAITTGVLFETGRRAAESRREEQR